MNNENLKSFRTTEEARRNGRKGGINSGKSKRSRKALVSQLKVVVTQPVADPRIKERLIKDGFEATYGGMVLRGIVRKAGSNANMARLLFDLLGESPELKLKQKELRLKEKMMERDQAEAGVEGVTIVDDTNKAE